MSDNHGQNGAEGRFTVRSPRDALQPSAPPPAPPPPTYRRRGGLLSQMSGLLTFVLIAGFIGLAGLAVVRQEIVAPGPLQADKSVVIPRNTGMSAAADLLLKEGIITDTTWFNIAARMRGGRLQAGEFVIKKNASASQVVETLVAGKAVDRKITIPEGLTSQQIVARIQSVEFLVGEVSQIPPEGSLLPDTYQVERGTTRDDFLKRLQREHDKLIDKIWNSRVDGLPVSTPEEMVTLASIVEKETGKGEERPRVAAVYINRLNTLNGDFINAAGKKEPPMTLDSDPSVIYGITRGSGVLGRGLLRSELQDETNPYNTYRRRGLPPGPIANPGKAALEAVAKPATSKELYFVADGTGGHIFAESLKDHNRNVAQWRKIEAERARAAEEKAGEAGTVDGATPAAPATPDSGEAQPDPQRQGALEDTLFLPDEWPVVVMLTERDLGLEQPFQLTQNLTPPKKSEFDGVPSYPVPANRRRNKKQEPQRMEGTVEPRMADDPESTVPESERRRVANAGEARAPARSLKRRRATDASEGKKFDPLLNKGYDLNSAQTVPRL
jgi:UPF0755 protein